MPSNTLSKTYLNPTALLSIVAIAALYIYAFFPVWRSLINTWSNSEDYSHAFFILPISVYLIWAKKEELAEMTFNRSVIGCLIVLFSCFLYLFALAAGVTTIASFSAILCLVGAFLAITGIRVSVKLMFPLLYLFLMIPIPSQLYFAATTPLQLIVSKVTVSLAFLMDIPIYREGNVLHLPERTLQVVAACSGMRSLISLATLSLLFGYLTLKSNTLRTILVGLSLPVAIFINIIRVSIMVLGFYYFDYDLTEGNPHTYLGMAVFALAIALMLLSQKILTRIER